MYPVLILIFQIEPLLFSSHHNDLSEKWTQWHGSISSVKSSVGGKETWILMLAPIIIESSYTRRMDTMTLEVIGISNQGDLGGFCGSPFPPPKKNHLTMIFDFSFYQIKRLEVICLLITSGKPSLSLLANCACLFLVALNHQHLLWSIDKGVWSMVSESPISV